MMHPILQIGTTGKGSAETQTDLVDWLPQAQRPLSAHRFMGRSLERVSGDVGAAEVANWAASALDGATPGKPNSVAGAPRRVAIELSAYQEGKTQSDLVRAMDRVVVRALLDCDGARSPGGVLPRRPHAHRRDHRPGGDDGESRRRLRSHPAQAGQQRRGPLPHSRGGRGDDPARAKRIFEAMMTMTKIDVAAIEAAAAETADA